MKSIPDEVQTDPVRAQAAAIRSHHAKFGNFYRDGHPWHSRPEFVPREIPDPDEIVEKVEYAINETGQSVPVEPIWMSLVRRSLSPWHMESHRMAARQWRQQRFNRIKTDILQDKIC